MADKAQTTWTCDRCKSQWQTLTDHNAQPERWHRLLDANPPRHAEPEKIGDVCEDCWTAFCSWWQNSPMAEPVVDRDALRIAQEFVDKFEQSGYGTRRPDRWVPKYDWFEALTLARWVLHNGGTDG